MVTLAQVTSMYDVLEWLNPAFYTLGFFALYLTEHVSSTVFTNLVVQSVLFFFVACIGAYRTGTMSYVDLAWPWGLVSLGVQAAFWNFAQGGSLKGYVVSAMYCVAGLRMGLGFLVRVIKEGKVPEFQRYEFHKMLWRQKHGTNYLDTFVGKMHMQKEILVQWLANISLLSVPFLLVPADSDKTFSTLELCGLAIWIFGFAFEHTADLQKKGFLAKPENKGKLVNIGLWRYSRHPNYFGEWMVWNGLVLFTIPAFLRLCQGWSVSTVLVGCLLASISPSLYYCLVYWTGAFPAEYMTRRKGYKAYQAETSMFFPWFPKLVQKKSQ